MTIEAHLQSIDASLLTIATALTAIAEGAGVPVTPKEEAPKEEKPKASGKSGTSRSAKASGTTQKSADKASKPEEKDGASDDDTPSLDDVRKALASLQKRATPKAARAVLEAIGGVTTLSKLDEDKYSDVITAANEKE